MNPELQLSDLIALSPLLIVFFSSMFVLLMESFAPVQAKKCGLFITLGALILACISIFYATPSTNPLLTPWIRFDSLAHFWSLFFLLIGIGVILISPKFHGEYFFLILSSMSGLLLIGAAADFLTLFLGIEALSIPLYILAGFIKKREISHESAMKYFLTGALSTAFLIYGIALIYGAIGTTQFHDLLIRYQSISNPQDHLLFMGGISFITLSLCFKATLVPFHQWAPDVYSGSPTSVTAFMAVATKVGAFAALTQIFFIALPSFNLHWNEAISFIAYATLIYANFVALKQTQLRRFFAYSGIAQAGFLLIAFVTGTEEAMSALFFYLIVYALATLGCFSVLSALDERQEGPRMQDLNGLFKRSKSLCIFFSLCLLTLGGVPPTAGFLAKLFILKGAFQAGHIGLVITGLLTSILSIYYYLRPIALMISEPTSSHKIHEYWSNLVLCYGTCALIIALSFFPLPLWDYLNRLK